MDRQHHGRHQLQRLRHLQHSNRQRRAGGVRIINIRNTISAWTGDRRGAAAVEMALVAPFLAVVVAGIASYAPQLDRVHKMRDAVSTGAGYVMTGGTDPTTIQSVAF